MSDVIIPLKKELEEKQPIWDRIHTLVVNDESKYTDEPFCRRLPNETMGTFKFRQRMFMVGFINPTVELITAPGSLIYANEVREEIDDVDQRLKMFTTNATRSASDAISLKLLLKEQICPSLRAYGTVFVLLDMPPIGSAASEEQQRADRIWPYVTLLDPLAVLNYEYENDELLWFAYTVRSRDAWINPTTKQPPSREEIRVWTREKYLVVSGGKVISERDNPFGYVPVIIQASFRPTTDVVLGVAPFFTSSNSIICANNHINVANMEIWKHASALMLVPRSSLGAVNSDIDALGGYHLKTLVDDGALVYEGDKAPGFLTRDLTVIESAMNQYREYMKNAFENEKNAKSVGKLGYGGDDVGDSASGFAKIIDREPMEANVIATAIDMQSIHRRIMAMAQSMIDGLPCVPAGTAQRFIVEYSMKYDVTPLATLLDETGKAIGLKIPSAVVLKELYKKIAARIITDRDVMQQATEEINAADVLGVEPVDQDLRDTIAGVKPDDSKTTD